MSPLALSIHFLQAQPDGRLLELARAGHERAFEALVRRYRRALLKYCRRLSPSEAAAEDSLQQALLQAWIALGSSSTEIRDARAWLYRIVHNVAISNLRRPVPDSIEIDPGEGTRGADHEVEQRLELRDALAGLASLPELQRQVMLSTALEGRSHEEVAAALGLSHGAVRGLIYRARATLRAAAATVMPSPLVHWAVRQGAGSGRSAAMVDALAGGGSVGLGGVLLKGGAVVVAAGALATAAGITGTHARHHAHVPPQAGSGRSGERAATSGSLAIASVSGSGSGSAAASQSASRFASVRSAYGNSGSGRLGSAGTARTAGPGRVASKADQLHSQGGHTSHSSSSHHDGRPGDPGSGNGGGGSSGHSGGGHSPGGSESGSDSSGGSGGLGSSGAGSGSGSGGGSGSSGSDHGGSGAGTTASLSSDGSDDSSDGSSGSGSGSSGSGSGSSGSGSGSGSGDHGGSGSGGHGGSGGGDRSGVGTTTTTTGTTTGSGD